MRKPVWSESEQKRMIFLRCADIPIFLHALVVRPFAQPLTSVPSRLAYPDLTTPCLTNQHVLGSKSALKATVKPSNMRRGLEGFVK